MVSLQWCRWCGCVIPKANFLKFEPGSVAAMSTGSEVLKSAASEVAKMVTEVAKKAEEAANELKEARESHRKVAKAFVWRGCPPSGAAAHPGVPSAGHGSGSDLAPSGPEWGRERLTEHRSAQPKRPHWVWR